MTQIGACEAASLAEQLAAEPVTAVYCSPRRRTRETAAAIADRHGLPVTVALPLDEIDFGSWTGQRFADLDGQPEWDRWNRERGRTRPPGGESMAEAISRASRFIEQVDGAGTVVFVTHCDIIRGLLCRQDGRSFDEIFSYDVQPGSVAPLVRTPFEAAA